MDIQIERDAPLPPIKRIVLGLTLTEAENLAAILANPERCNNYQHYTTLANGLGALIRHHLDG